MGYNIGTRLIEDFLAKSNLGRCVDFRETGEVVAKVNSHNPHEPCSEFIIDWTLRSVSKHS